MNYQVLARKWRPQGFDELVGQKHVSKTLGNAIDSGRLAHAYIFAGLRGTGKTTVARIFAACLNAEDGPTLTPDPESVVSKEIAESRNMDVLELDAATRTQVDNIRELQEIISYAPVRDRYKVLIIDEAHMLSRSASNALLKTLEEPPPHVIFILATTEIQKLLPTILSRCQVFEFRRVPPAETAAHLRKICDAEEISISDMALDKIARAGEGSVRDSLSVLERVLAFCGKEVDDDEVLRVLGAVQTEVIETWIQALAARDAGGMLEVLDGLVDEGHDLVHFWSELIGVLRDLLYLRAVPDRKSALSRSADEAERLAAAAESLSVEDLTRTFQILADLEGGLKSSSQPRFLFEACAIRLASLGSVRPIEEFLAGTRSPGAPSPGAPASGRSAAPSPRRSPASPAQKKKPVAPAEPAVPAGNLLRQLTAAVSEDHAMLGSILESAMDYRIDGERFLLRFPSGSQLLVRQLERPARAEALGEAVQALVGRKLAIATEIGGGPGPVADTGAEPESRMAAGPPAAEEHRGNGGASRRSSATAVANRGSGQRELMREAQDEPGVRRLLKEFSAQVVELKPLQAPAAPPIDDLPPVEDEA